jgi:hypothetical protein
MSWSNLGINSGKFLVMLVCRKRHSSQHHCWECFGAGFVENAPAVVHALNLCRILVLVIFLRPLKKLLAAAEPRRHGTLPLACREAGSMRLA